MLGFGTLVAFLIFAIAAWTAQWCEFRAGRRYGACRAVGAGSGAVAFVACLASVAMPLVGAMSFFTS